MAHAQCDHCLGGSRRRPPKSTAVADGDSKLEPMLDVSKLLSLPTAAPVEPMLEVSNLSSLPAAASLGDPVLEFLKLLSFVLESAPSEINVPSVKMTPLAPFPPRRA